MARRTVVTNPRAALSAPSPAAQSPRLHPGTENEYLAALFEVFIEDSAGSPAPEEEIIEAATHAARMALKTLSPVAYVATSARRFLNRSILAASESARVNLQLGLAEEARLERERLKDRALVLLGRVWEREERHRPKLDLVLSYLAGEYDPARIAEERGVDRNLVEQHKRRGCQMLLKHDPTLGPVLGVHPSKSQGMLAKER